MSRRLLSSLLATCLGGAIPCLAALDPGCEGDAVKGEVKVLSPEVTGVKIEVNFNGNSGEAQAPPGMDERAGQKGATEYEGRALKCATLPDGRRSCD